MIELNEYPFPADDCYRLTLRRLMVLYVRFFVYGCSVMGFFWLLTGTPVMLLTWVIGTAVIFSLSAFFVARRYAYSKENADIFRKRKVTFDADGCHYVLENGAESRFPLSMISSAETRGDYYLLYLTKHSYLPVPRAAFRSDDDRRWFEETVTAGKWKKSHFARNVIIYLLITASLLAAGYVWGKSIQARLHFPEKVQQQDYMPRPTLFGHIEPRYNE